jgi:excisionase family DNA binding protein
VPDPELLTTGQLARALNVSRTAILNWAEAGQIRPEVRTPGGHYRWVLDDVKRQLSEAPPRGE